jgi:hypothetical protein
MLLLMTFLGRPPDGKSLREYQRDRWGRVEGGETCVIELSGLAANSLKVDRDRTQFRQERIAVIRQRMLTYKPSLVVMYGKSESEHWQEIAGSDQTWPPDSILQRESTVLVYTRHPVTPGRCNADWLDLGERLRHVALGTGTHSA